MTTTDLPDLPDLPEVIDRYQRAHDRHDTEASLSTFTADATVIDDGNTYVGVEQIRQWLDRAASEYTYTRTLTGIDLDGSDTVVTHNHIEGNFPGGEVDLHYRFELRDGDIHRLEIGP